MRTGNLVIGLTLALALAFAIAHCIVVLRPRESFYSLDPNKRGVRIITVATVPVVILTAVLLIKRDDFGYWPTFFVFVLVGITMVGTVMCELPLRKIKRAVLNHSYFTQFLLLTSIFMMVLQHSLSIGPNPESQTGTVEAAAWFVLALAFASLVSAAATLKSYLKEQRLI